MPPHIVLLVADDWGFELFPRRDTAGDVHKNLLPRIREAFVDDGLVLDRHYAHSTCAPSRASLLSGRWPHRAYDFSPEYEKYWGCRGVSPAMALLSERLQAQAYRTHFVGKWHLVHSTHCS